MIRGTEEHLPQRKDGQHRSPRRSLQTNQEKRSSRRVGARYGGVIKVHNWTASPKGRAKLLSFDDSALHSNHGGVSAVFGSQFEKDVSDLTLHGIFAH
jgi:hypothetical protein